MHESSGSLSSLPRSITPSGAAQATPMASPIALARFPEPVTEYDRSGLTSFNPVGLISPNPVGDSGIYLPRTSGLRAPWPPIPGVGLGGIVPLVESTVLGGLVPCTEHAILSGLPLASTAFTIFAHTRREQGLAAFLVPRGDSSPVFLPPSPTPKAVPGRGSISPAATPLSLRFLPYPSRAARAPQKPWLLRRASHSRLLYQGVPHRRWTPPRPLVRLCPFLPCLALQLLRH